MSTHFSHAPNIFFLWNMVWVLVTYSFRATQKKAVIFVALARNGWSCISNWFARFFQRAYYQNHYVISKMYKLWSGLTKWVTFIPFYWLFGRKLKEHFELFNLITAVSVSYIWIEYQNEGLRGQYSPSHKNVFLSEIKRDWLVGTN